MRRLIGADVKPVYAEFRQGDVRDSQADIAEARRVSVTRRRFRSKRDCA